MNAYITFFSKRNNKYLHIDNGFSFGREKKEEDVDLFFHSGRDPAYIEKHLKKYPSFDRIYCSLSYGSQLTSIEPLLGDNWIIGGPAVARLVATGIELPCTIVSGFFEEYLGKDTLDSNFDPYFNILAKAVKIPHLFCNCSIGKGCYWSKCKFCDYPYYDSKCERTGKVNMRPNVGAIVEQLHPIEGSKTTNFHLGTPAIPPGALAEVLNAKRDKKVWLTIFLRADNSVLQVFKNCNGNSICEGIMFSIGCESLSQSALEKLGKGSTVDNTLKLTRLILERGGSVVLGIMDHYVFSDRQMVKEYLESLEILKDIVKKYPKHRVKFTNNGITHWPTKEAVSEFTDDFTAVQYDNQYERYLANISENSEAFKCNKDISLALVNSGINQFGASFVSLR